MKTIEVVNINGEPTLILPINLSSFEYERWRKLHPSAIKEAKERVRVTGERERIEIDAPICVIQPDRDVNFLSEG